MPLSALSVLVVAFLAAAQAAHAAPRMCAFRAGPQGPCTCKTDTDAAGQFSVVSNSHCRRTKAAAPSRPQVPPAEPSDEVRLTPPSPDAAAANASDAPNPADTEAASAPPPPAVAQNLTTGAVGKVGAKLDEVRARGKIVCGISTGLLGFSHRNGAGDWTGVDAEFCRAVAIATLGDGSKVDYVPLDATERFDALKSGKIDVLSRNTTWNMNRAVDLGLEFVGVLYFDGQSFMTTEDRGLVSAQQLAGLKVCVQSATTTEKNMAYYFHAHRLAAVTQTYKTREELVRAYQSGECDAYTADRSSLYSDRASFTEPLKHAVLPEVISKEPLSPAVLQGDQEWAEIVRWTLAGLINAEEVGLDRAAAAASGDLAGDAQRLVEGAAASGKRLRLEPAWLRSVIASVGNYGELFESNIGKTSPLGMERGINALWKNGGILYAPPMW